LKIGGELDMASTPALRQALDEAFRSGDDPLVVDLRCLRFMDANGLELLVDAQEQARRRGRRFGVVKNGPSVQRLMQLTDATRRLRLVDAPEDMLQAS
jgi:anti-sigma B factor antagonist